MARKSTTASDVDSLVSMFANLEKNLRESAQCLEVVKDEAGEVMKNEDGSIQYVVPMPESARNIIRASYNINNANYTEKRAEVIRKMLPKNLSNFNAQDVANFWKLVRPMFSEK